MAESDINGNAVPVLELECQDRHLDFSTAPGQINYFEWLPNEMLLEIFSWLQHPKDLLPCTQVCLSWDNLLLSKEIYLKFYQVLPHLAKYLNLKDLLNVRATCHGWKLAVEEYVDNNYSVTRIKNSSHVMRFWNSAFCTTRNLEMFMRDMDRVPASHNPIVDRHVYFATREQDFTEYWSQVQTVLRKFGSHIFKSEFDFGRTQLINSTPSDIATLIFDNLTLLPNLKELVLFCGVYDEHVEPEEEDCMQLRRFLSSLPLPSLRSLVTLNLIKLPAPISQVLMNAFGPQLKTLALCCNTFTFENIHFEKLENASIMVQPTSIEIEPGAFTSESWTQSLLSKVINLRAPLLRKLYLEIDLEENDLSALVSVLNRFRGTLQDLTLAVSRGSDLENCEVLGNLHLPKLTTFSMSQFFLESYDFLPGVSQILQHFEICVQPMFGLLPHCLVLKKNSMGVEGFGDGCVCDSEIWKIIPTLQTVGIYLIETPYEDTTTRYRLCSRKMWEHLQKLKENGSPEACSALVPCLSPEIPDDDDVDNDDVGIIFFGGEFQFEPVEQEAEDQRQEDE